MLHTPPYFFKIPDMAGVSCRRMLLTARFFLFFAIFSGVGLGYAEDFHNALSFEGFTGLLNTPNAEVTDEGNAYLLFTNQQEPMFGPVSYEENYFVSLGFFSFLELGGGLINAPPTGPDHLLTNLKLKLPFEFKRYHLPDIAVGMQDFGGGTHFLRTNYLVMSQEWNLLRFSLGYGTGPDRMKGVFGGVELRALDWLYLVGENDTNATYAGIRLVTPELFGVPARAQFTAKTSVDNNPGNWQIAIGLQASLGGKHDPSPPMSAETAYLESADKEGVSDGKGGWLPIDHAFPEATARKEPEASPSKIAGDRTEAEKTTSVEKPKLEDLRSKLVAEGFQNVRIGLKGGDVLVVEYENSRFNHNELDGLGVVVGTTVKIVPSGYDILRLVMKKKNIRMAAVGAKLEYFRKFMQNPENYGMLAENLSFSDDVEEDAQIEFLPGKENSSLLGSSLLIYPNVTTYIGTEVGMFNYLASARLDYYLNLWKGAVVNAMEDVPLTWSENFNSGKYWGDTRKTPEFERLMLLQAIKPSSHFMLTLGGGMILHDYYGTFDEAMWTPGDGTSRFTVKYGSFSTADNVHPGTYDVTLGSYRYYHSPLDLYLELIGGKFLNGDNGYRLELKRFFGDTAITFYITDSTLASGGNAKVAGATIALPLTPRRDMKQNVIQVKGSDEWSYSEKTALASNGAPNYLYETVVGVDPSLLYNLEHIFYNRDRLTRAYIVKHLLRARDAYVTYFAKDEK